MKKLYSTLFIVLLCSGLLLLNQQSFSQDWNPVQIDSLLTTSGLNITTDASGNPYIVYEDETNHELKLATWNGTYFDFSTIDTDIWNSGELKFKPDGNMAVLYYADPTSSTMTYAEHDGTAWNISETGISAGAGIGGGSLDFDAAGNPHICFHKYGTGWELHYARLDGENWVEETVDEVGLQSSLVVGDDGTIHIAFNIPVSGDLKYAQKAAGGSWTIEDVSSGNPYNRPCIKLLSNGNPCIGFTHDEKVKLAEWDGTAWQITEIKGIGYGSDSYVCMDLDNNDESHFTLYRTYTLRYVHWDGTNASETDIEMIGSTGAGPKIACGADGSIHIVYNNKYITTGGGGGTSVNLQQENHLDFEAFPNPFYRDITLVNPEGYFKSLAIYNSTGQLVKTINSDADRIEWNGCNESGAAVEPGIYYIVMESKKRRVTKKVVKK